MTHPLWLAQNLMTHPFVRAQNRVTQPPFASTPPHPPILIDQSLKSRISCQIPHPKNAIRDPHFQRLARKVAAVVYERRSLTIGVFIDLTWKLLVYFGRLVAEER